MITVFGDPRKTMLVLQRVYEHFDLVAYDRGATSTDERLARQAVVVKQDMKLLATAALEDHPERAPIATRPRRGAVHLAAP